MSDSKPNVKVGDIMVIPHIPNTQVKVLTRPVFKDEQWRVDIRIINTGRRVDGAILNYLHLLTADYIKTELTK